MSALPQEQHDAIRSAPLGPESLTWQLFGDLRVLLLGPRAAVLQNMLPALGQGVEDHSVWFEETMARLQRSIGPIHRTVYGRTPERQGQQVRDFHRHIKGKLPDGRPYSALNPDTFYWAHATFVEHTIVAAETFRRPLTLAEKDQMIAESVTWYRRYGVSERLSTGPIPSTWAEFESYWERLLDDELIGHRTAAYGVGYARKGWPRPQRIPRLAWWLLRRPINDLSAFLTIGGLPPRARELLRLPWTERQQRRHDRFASVVRRMDPLYRRLPRRFRMAPIADRAYARESA